MARAFDAALKRREATAEDLAQAPVNVLREASEVDLCIYAVSPYTDVKICYIC